MLKLLVSEQHVCDQVQRIQIILCRKDAAETRKELQRAWDKTYRSDAR